MVSVPSSVVRKIGEDIKNLVVGDLAGMGIFNLDQLKVIELTIDEKTRIMALNSAKSCEGWTLSAEQASDIAILLKDYRKIDAIKEFRAATGAGLKQAKYFIDKFGIGVEGFVNFRQAFE